MRLAVLALVVATPAYADDAASVFRGKQQAWDYETVNGASLDKLRPMKKARVRCSVEKLHDNENVSIKVLLKCGAKTFTLVFDDAATELAFPRTKPAQLQKLEIRGKDRDVWFVEHGTRAIGFLPDLGPVLLCDGVKPYRCLRLAAEHTAVSRMTKADTQRMIDLLSASSDDSWSSGDMSRRKPGADLGKQLDNVSKNGGSVTLGGGSRGTSGGTAVGVGTATGPKVGTGGGGKVDGLGPTAPKGPSGRISLTSKSTTDTTSLTADIVASKVLSAYVPGLKRCYKNVLAKDPSARGKLDIALAVNETGRAQPKVSGFSQELDGCVQALAQSWRFPIPKDADGEATTASFKLSFTLVPE